MTDNIKPCIICNSSSIKYSQFEQAHYICCEAKDIIIRLIESANDTKELDDIKDKLNIADIHQVLYECPLYAIHKNSIEEKPSKETKELYNAINREIVLRMYRNGDSTIKRIPYYMAEKARLNDIPELMEYLKDIDNIERMVKS